MKEMSSGSLFDRRATPSVPEVRLAFW